MGGVNIDIHVARRQVVNEINLKISNINESITNIVNQTTTNITTELINTQKASINAELICENRIRVGGSIVAANKSNLSIEQTCDMKVENQAIINIVQSPTNMTALANSLANSVNQQIATDQAKQTAVNTLAKISKQTQDAGGPDQLIDKIMRDTVIPMMNAGNGQEDIRNSINLNIENTNIDTTNITNIINTSISNKISNAAEASCNLNVAGSNELDVEDDIASLNDSNLTIKQAVSITAFNKCFIDLKMGDSITNGVLNNAKFANLPMATFATNSTTTRPGTTTTTRPGTTTTTRPGTTTTTTTTRPISPTSSNNNILYISLGVGALVVFLILMFFLMRGGDDDDQYGGSSNNLYLYAALFALFLFISTKSITMCGLILLGFVGYILTHN